MTYRLKYRPALSRGNQVGKKKRTAVDAGLTDASTMSEDSSASTRSIKKLRSNNKTPEIRKEAQNDAPVSNRASPEISNVKIREIINSEVIIIFCFHFTCFYHAYLLTCIV